MAREGRLFSHTVMLGASSALCKIFSLCFLPFLTRALTPAQFGEVEIFVSTAVLLLPITGFYAPQALFRFYADQERGAVRAGAWLLLIGTVSTAALIPLFSRSGGVTYPFLLLFYVLSSVLHSFLAQLLRAKGAFGLFALQQGFCTVATLLLQLTFLALVPSAVLAYLLGVISGDLITFFILLIPLWGDLRRCDRAHRTLVLRMLRYALPLIPTALLFWVMTTAERYFLLHFHGERALGIYAAAGRFPALIGFACSVFFEVWHYVAIRETGGEGALFDGIFALLLPTLFGAGILLAIAAPLWVRVFLAREYAAAARILPLLSLSAVCAGLSHFLDSVYTVRMHSHFSLGTISCAAAFHVLCCFFLIPRGGVMGAALSSALSFAVLLFLRLWHTARELAFERRTGSTFFTLICFFAFAILYAMGMEVPGCIFALGALAIQGRAGLFALRFLQKRTRLFLCGREKRGKSIEKMP